MLFKKKNQRRKNLVENQNFNGYSGGKKTGGTVVGGGKVIFPGVGAPHQPTPPRGQTLVFMTKF